MLISRVSPFSGKLNQMNIEVTQEQLDRYASGREMIHKVFPHLTADEREFIKTGITAQEWDNAFGED